MSRGSSTVTKKDLSPETVAYRFRVERALILLAREPEIETWQLVERLGLSETSIAKLKKERR